MELRKDPITNSWVVVGDQGIAPAPETSCPLCSAQSAASPLLALARLTEIPRCA